MLKFGPSGGWSLASIRQAARAKSGHHHLLVHRDRPLNVKQPRPFNEQCIHFGKGPMEQLLSLAPGSCALQPGFVDNLNPGARLATAASAPLRGR